MSKPMILVTNDDGILAKGIAELVEVVRQFGNVLVVAPDSPQSGQGHAITLEHPLRLNKVNVFDGIEAYECNGTPADCVKLAKHFLRKGENIDLCVSGINHGSNTSINILYSGTMSAAMEAAMEGIDSIGFSLDSFSAEADFATAKQVVWSILAKVLPGGFPGPCRLLNVNIPNVLPHQLKGIKVCRQSNGYWKEAFMEGSDPRGRNYYWLTGEFVNKDNGIDTDLWAMEHGYASVVPSMYDLTYHSAIKDFNLLNT